MQSPDIAKQERPRSVRQSKAVVEASIRAYRSEDIESGRRLWRDLTQRHRDIYEDQGIGGEYPEKALDAYLSDARLHGPWLARIEGESVGLVGLLLEGDEGEP